MPIQIALVAMSFAHVSKAPDMKAESEPADSAILSMLEEQETYWIEPVVLDAHWSLASG